MLPTIFLIPLLQPVAPAHVCERHRKKTGRQQHEHNVLHQLILPKNAGTSRHFRRPQNFTRMDMSMKFSSRRKSGNHTVEFCGALVQKVVAGPSAACPEETPLLQM